VDASVFLLVLRSLHFSEEGLQGRRKRAAAGDGNAGKADEGERKQPKVTAFFSKPAAGSKTP
jgi:hypothetical protein